MVASFLFARKVFLGELRVGFAGFTIKGFDRKDPLKVSRNALKTLP